MLRFSDLIRCPNCGSHLSSRLNHRTGGENGELFCENCDARLPIAGQIVDALPDAFRRTIEQWHLEWTDSRFFAQVLTTDTKKSVGVAIEWLEQTLHLDADTLFLGVGRSRPMQRLLTCLSEILLSSELDDVDMRELFSVLSSELMAAGYREHVADPAVASMEAVNYEKYEDIVLRCVINECLIDDRDVVLIELGSGVGRVLHQYGSCVSTQPNACVMYRRLGPDLYQPSSLNNPQQLSLLLGVDFSAYMLRKSVRWLQHDKLGDLVRDRRIVQVLGSVRSLSFDFDRVGLGEATKIVCILFQTLGNQIGRDLQLSMLRKAREIAGEDGIVIVSAFNGAAFDEQAQEYYESIRGSVGGAWEWGHDIFLSKKGVYSRWMSSTELLRLFEDAGMPKAAVLSNGELRLFPEYGRYLDDEGQTQYKRRAMIGISSQRRLSHLVRTVAR